MSLLRWLDWRRWMVYTHRWLGIVGGVLFVAWFVSGVVMMYARMPGLANEERLARAPALDLSSATVSPIEAGANRRPRSCSRRSPGQSDGARW